MHNLFPRPRLDTLIGLVAALSIAVTAIAQSGKKGGYPPTLAGGAPCGSCDAPEKLSWNTVIPPETEPGDPMVITGRVFQSEGKTPAEGMVLWVYQTDRTGYYNEKDDASHPRLNGWMKIGADGKYEFRTIRPGAYPHRTTPAHIHAHVYGPGYSERSIDDYWFKDDPRINEKEVKHAADNGGHPVIVALKRGDDGVWRGVRDIKLQGGQ
ncbi:MAG: protocatechuate 3,4-dioxygenase [Chthoniobacterales bacterium]